MPVQFWHLRRQGKLRCAISEIDSRLEVPVGPTEPSYSSTIAAQRALTASVNARIINCILCAFLFCQAVEEVLVVVLSCRPIQKSWDPMMEGYYLDLRVLWWVTVSVLRPERLRIQCGLRTNALACSVCVQPVHRLVAIPPAHPFHVEAADAISKEARPYCHAITWPAVIWMCISSLTTSSRC